MKAAYIQTLAIYSKSRDTTLPERCKKTTGSISTRNAELEDLEARIPEARRKEKEKDIGPIRPILELRNNGNVHNKMCIARNTKAEFLRLRAPHE